MSKSIHRHEWTIVLVIVLQIFAAGMVSIEGGDPVMGYVNSAVIAVFWFLSETMDRWEWIMGDWL